VRGYKEEGTTTTPFDMCVRNEIDRFHIAIDVIDRVKRLEGVSGHLRQELLNMLTDHGRYIREHGEDMPAIREWQWPLE
jgi:xylulose-5-phosphate/fructose-6-phosphate phosphoketolase